MAAPLQVARPRLTTDGYGRDARDVCGHSVSGAPPSPQDRWTTRLYHSGLVLAFAIRPAASRGNRLPRDRSPTHTRGASRAAGRGGERGKGAFKEAVGNLFWEEQVAAERPLLPLSGPGRCSLLSRQQSRPRDRRLNGRSLLITAYERACRLKVQSPAVNPSYIAHGGREFASLHALQPKYYTTYTSTFTGTTGKQPEPDLSHLFAQSAGHLSVGSSTAPLLPSTAQAQTKTPRICTGVVLQLARLTSGTAPWHVVVGLAAWRPKQPASTAASQNLSRCTMHQQLRDRLLGT